MVFSTVLLVGLLTAADDPKPGAVVGAAAADEQVIQALICKMGEEWNKHDLPSFVSQLAEDADTVNRFGKWMKGRAEIEKHLLVLHSSPYRDHLAGRSSKVEQIRFLTPDVAVAHERTIEETGRSVRTYVLQKRDGKWWIQSADIIQEADPSGH